MSHTYRGPTREQHRRTMRRLRQQDRDRAHVRLETLEPSLSSIKEQLVREEERKRIESLWEQSIDFFANSSGNIDSAKEESDGPAK